MKNIDEWFMHINLLNGEYILFDVEIHLLSEKSMKKDDMFLLRAAFT